MGKKKRAAVISFTREKADRRKKVVDCLARNAFCVKAVQILSFKDFSNFNRQLNPESRV